MKYLSLGQQMILLFLGLFLLITLSAKFYLPTLFTSTEEICHEVVVETSGEVCNPGIYLFENPPTLQHVIEEAGGLKEGVSIDLDGRSETLETGTLVTVLRESNELITVRVGSMDVKARLVFSIPIDLNRASSEDLCLIPGIGPSLAREIIVYRQKRNGFRSVEELNQVKGMGEKKWESLNRYFTTNWKRDEENQSAMKVP